MKEKLLQLLQQADGFVSGQMISDQFGVSRTAIWKVIRQLEEAGYEIEAVRNKGYRLISEPDLMTAERIEQELETATFARRLYAFDEIDSTNNEAKRLAEAGAKHGTLVVADKQTAGRGRMGRPWISPAGSGIWMSLLVRPELSPEKASMLTLLMAVAIRRAIAEVAEIEPKIKWPNDIILKGRKVCGILTEMSAEPGRINHIVIGMGINVTDEAFDEAIKDVAISIEGAGGKTIARAKLIAAVMKHFEELYGAFIKVGNLSSVLDEYNKELIHCESEVRIIDPRGEYTAIAHGIDETGCLKVTKIGEQTERLIMSGEISVRGILGYVPEA